MLLYFLRKCNSLRLSVLEYFEVAYMATFGKPHPNVGDDYAQYRLHSVLPGYVVSYLKKQQEAENEVQSVQ